MTIKRRTCIVAVVATVVALFSYTQVRAAAGDERVEAAILLKMILAGSHRSPENRARDRYRHPLETLTWFGIRPDMTVVEVWPGGAGIAKSLPRS